MSVEINQKHLLTPKQQRIAAFIAEGLLNKQIAEEIGHTLDTTKNYVQEIFDKMGFRSRLELALWWVKQEYDTLSLGDKSQ